MIRRRSQHPAQSAQEPCEQSSLLRHDSLFPQRRKWCVVGMLAGFAALTELHLATQNNEPPSLSIFDQCSHPSSASSQKNDQPLCTYFRPALFFQEGHAGYSYRDELAQTQSNHPILEDFSWQVNNWGNGYGPPMRSDGSWSKKGHILSITSLSTPKAGSRTQWQLFLDYFRQEHKPATTGGKKVRNRGPPVQSIGQVTPKYSLELHRRQTALSNGSTKPRPDIVFAVVRDPVSRFFSSLAQLLSAKGMPRRRCRGCDTYLEPCLLNTDPGDTSSQPLVNNVVQCMIDSIRKNGFWNEHLIPSAYFVTRPLHGNDVEVAVFPMEQLDRLVAEFVGFEKDIHANEGGGKKVDKYVKELTEGIKSALKTEGALDEDLVRDICSIYDVDVAIMRHLGFPVKYCDEQ